MFTPIKYELDLLLQDLQLRHGIITDEQIDIANNPCAYIKYEGKKAQLQEDIERVSQAYIDISNIVEDIMKNAMGGNYSAKMQIVEDENILLRKKIDMLETQAETIVNNLNNGNKIRLDGIDK